MPYEISYNPAVRFSPWPHTQSESTDTLADGSKISLPSGMSIPDYIRRVYQLNRVDSITERFGFLSRDDKERRYSSATMDPFTMPSDVKKIQPAVTASVHRLIKHIKDRWVQLQLPLTIDKQRKIEIPDVVAVSNAYYAADTPLRRKIIEHRDEISFLISNLSIFLKTALPRVIKPGWWVVSYSGSVLKEPMKFASGLTILSKLIDVALASPAYRKAYDEVTSTTGDPIDTGVGYPYYSAELDKIGSPLSKLRVIAKYKGIFSGGPLSKDAFLEQIASRGETEFERNYPLAIACIRRLQNGNKSQHVWEASAGGLRLKRDERGFNTVRVAWMAPYIQNLSISPFQSVIKALRKVLPGLFMNAEFKTAMMESIRANKLFLAESDFSNYDRTIPTDLMDAIIQVVSKRLENGELWASLLQTAYRDVPIIWPDYAGHTSAGWIFKPEKLALLSGLKITSDIGTLCTFVIIMSGLVNNKVKTIDELVNYYSEAIKTPDISKFVRENPPLVNIQSDDVLFSVKQESDLLPIVKSFQQIASDAGMEAEVIIGDKYLMRHCSGGRDLPVWARWFQNTLSNEDPVTDALKFLVGLLVRTDGLGGFKIDDPFSTGKKQGMELWERDLGIICCEETIKFMTTAVAPVASAIEVVELLLRILTSSVAKNGRWYARPELIDIFAARRSKALKTLADREMPAFFTTGLTIQKQLAESLIYALHKASFSPAALATLETIIQGNPELRQLLDKVQGREHQFYEIAMDTIGLPTRIKFK